MGTSLVIVAVAAFIAVAALSILVATTALTVIMAPAKPTGPTLPALVGADQPVHYTIVEIDVANSGTRDDHLQLRMRAELRQIVRSVLARQRLDPSNIDRRDLGDGMRLIVPAHVSPQTLIHPFLPDLAAALREHRKGTTDSARMRLRVAVHMGLLHRDADGWAGTPLVHCARLLDAHPLRQILATAPQADLVVAVSEPVYHEVVRHTYGIDPTTYHRIEVTAKETAATAWMHVPGYPFGPAGVPSPAPAPSTGPDRCPAIAMAPTWPNTPRSASRRAVRAATPAASAGIRRNAPRNFGAPATVGLR